MVFAETLSGAYNNCSDEILATPDTATPKQTKRFISVKKDHHSLVARPLVHSQNGHQQKAFR